LKGKATFHYYENDTLIESKKISNCQLLHLHATFIDLCNFPSA
jgi:hypothetical protein